MRFPGTPNKENKMNLHISPGNTKMGNIPSFSLPAITTCPGSTPLCRKHCYANRNAQMYKDTAECYKRNHAEAEQSNFLETLGHHIHTLNARYFRIHVCGDFYDQRYLNIWTYIGKEFPNMDFLAFSKSFHLDYSNAPNNLNVIWSVFPDTEMSTVPSGPRAFTDFSETHVDAPYAPGITDSAIKCAGLCTTCGTCYHSNENQLDTIFEAHGGSLSKRSNK